jgi:hypothetical protein
MARRQREHNGTRPVVRARRLPEVHLLQDSFVLQGQFHIGNGVSPNGRFFGNGASSIGTVWNRILRNGGLRGDGRNSSRLSSGGLWHVGLWHGGLWHGGL